MQRKKLQLSIRILAKKMGNWWISQRVVSLIPLQRNVYHRAKGSWGAGDSLGTRHQQTSHRFDLFNTSQNAKKTIHTFLLNMFYGLDATFWWQPWRGENLLYCVFFIDGSKIVKKPSLGLIFGSRTFIHDPRVSSKAPPKNMVKFYQQILNQKKIPLS